MERIRMSRPIKVNKAYLKIFQLPTFSNKNSEKNSERLMDNLKARMYRRGLIFMVDQMIGGKTPY